MHVGQVLQAWWQNYVLGRYKTPQDIFLAAASETPDNALPSDRFLSTPDDTALWDVPQRLQASSRFLTAGYLSQSERADWRHCDPRLMRWAALFIEYARKRRIPLYVHTALRDEAAQNAAFDAGNSKLRYPKGAHNIGEAVDIVHSVYHWNLTRDEWAFLNVLGNLALARVNSTLKTADKLQLVWGGSFKSLYDPAHYEVADYRKRTRRLLSGAPIHRTPRAILRGISPRVSVDDDLARWGLPPIKPWTA